MIEEGRSYTPRFIDAESDYRENKEDDFSFRVMIMQQVKRILSLACKEFRGGYWQERVVQGSNGMMVEKVYVPDTREEYGNAIDALYDIIYPHFTSSDDKNVEFDCSKINEQLDKLSAQETTDMILNSKLRLHRKLLQRISKFLRIKHYFETIGIEE